HRVPGRRAALLEPAVHRDIARQVAERPPHEEPRGHDEHPQHRAGHERAEADVAQHLLRGGSGRVELVAVHEGMHQTSILGADPDGAADAHPWKPTADAPATTPPRRSPPTTSDGWCTPSSTRSAAVTSASTTAAVATAARPRRRSSGRTSTVRLTPTAAAFIA